MTDETEFSLLRWDLRTPPALVPTRVSDVTTSLLGRRIIWHRPDGGGRSIDGLRACSEVGRTDTLTYPSGRVESGAPVVAITSESDYYREQRGGPAADVVWIPAAWAWIEEPLDLPWMPPDLDAQGDILPAERALSLLRDPGTPPVRWPRPAATVPRLLGARVLVNAESGWLDDTRVVGEPIPGPSHPDTLNDSRGLDSLGEPAVVTWMLVCSEASWWRWHHTGQEIADPLPVQTSLVWAI